VSRGSDSWRWRGVVMKCPLVQDPERCPRWRRTRPEVAASASCAARSCSRRGYHYARRVRILLRELDAKFTRKTWQFVTARRTRIGRTRKAGRRAAAENPCNGPSWQVLTPWRHLSRTPSDHAWHHFRRPCPRGNGVSRARRGHRVGCGVTGRSGRAARRGGEVVWPHVEFHQDTDAPPDEPSHHVHASRTTCRGLLRAR
jgi:hypothetical protein